jgi:hypothetical protein
MPRRRALTGFLLAIVSLVGTVFFRRRAARRRDRVDVYFDDGSMVSLDEASPETAAIFPLVHTILETARR